MQSGNYLDMVRKLALALPSVEEGTSYGTPAFHLRGKYLARLLENGDTLVLRMDYDMRDLMLQCEPDVYYITDHYRDYPLVLVRLAAIDPTELYEHLQRAWLACAPKKLRDSYHPHV